MEFDNANVILNQLIFDAEGIYNYAKDIRPKWDMLDYSKNGVSQLFKEFVRTGGQYSYIISALSDLKLKRSSVTRWLREQQVQISSSVDLKVGEKAGEWVKLGYSQSERSLLAQIPLAEESKQLRLIGSKIQQLDDILSVLERMVQELSDFRRDAQTISNLLNFGNMLKEIV